MRKINRIEWVARNKGYQVPNFLKPFVPERSNEEFKKILEREIERENQRKGSLKETGND